MPGPKVVGLIQAIAGQRRPEMSLEICRAHMTHAITRVFFSQLPDVRSICTFSVVIRQCNAEWKAASAPWHWVCVSGNINSLSAYIIYLKNNYHSWWWNAKGDHTKGQNLPQWGENKTSDTCPPPVSWCTANMQCSKRKKTQMGCDEKTANVGSQESQLKLFLDCTRLQVWQQSSCTHTR